MRKKNSLDREVDLLGTVEHVEHVEHVEDVEVELVEYSHHHRVQQF